MLGARADDVAAHPHRPRRLLLHHAHPDPGLDACDHIVADDDVAHIGPIAGDDADPRHVVDRVVGHHRVRLGVDADRPRIRIGRRRRRDVAHDIAGAGRQVPAAVEIGNRDAGRRAVDDVVGDHRAREPEFGKDRHLARAEARVAADLRVVPRVHAHGRERAADDDIVAHDHAIGLIDVDAVARLPVAAAPPVDRLDPVAADDRAVVPVGAAPDADAGIAAPADVIAANHQAAAVLRMDGGVGQLVEAAVLDRQRRVGGHDAAAPEQEAAMAEPHRDARVDLQQPVPAAGSAAGESHILEHQIVGDIRLADRRRVHRDQHRQPRLADDADRGRKFEIVRKNLPAGEQQRPAVVMRRVECCLQLYALVVERIEAHAVIGRGVDRLHGAGNGGHRQPGGEAAQHQASRNLDGGHPAIVAKARANRHPSCTDW